MGGLSSALTKSVTQKVRIVRAVGMTGGSTTDSVTGLKQESDPVRLPAHNLIHATKKETMKREIKFRAWDIAYKQMYYPTTELYVEWDKHYGSKLICEVATEKGSRALSDTEYEIVQFTGLKDKNGKDIYEGDIVDQELWIKVGEYARTIGVVKYSAPHFISFCVGEWEGAQAKLNGNAIVIGNIYENPELLNPSA